ncbi:MAG: DEAD/DEAH box helicase, partial [Pseudomonas formosensis]|nr:DEAD/DEAH box helicase [Halopseudomonas formosensis]
MFTELSLHERLLKALAELSFEKPTPVQAAAIPPAIAGEDLYIIAQTGSGKTAAYVLPILQRLLEDDSKALAPRALVLSPTRELAQQILKDVQALARFTFLKAELVIGGEDFKVQAAKLRKNPDIVIATPGRTLEQLEAGGLDLSEVQTLVIDEADRMLDMGFSEDVLSIASACPEQRQTMLFSAT